MDNCSSHIENETVEGLLKNITTVFEQFSPNATDLFPPAHSFAVQKLKYSWSEKKHLYRFKCATVGTGSTQQG